ncbi:hypothetical protein CPLU01_13637 [Colletotrichum plurivorum]|uniref:Uncharacterized protein n=1 Tax=Colletotrichum plurivorum TaxID=2175906 RepID=A0A8H6JPZ8_9PEZI|nr:hypothetical protein CPLU01_13637 [Colletotrichum plurivorum]
MDEVSVGQAPPGVPLAHARKMFYNEEMSRTGKQNSMSAGRGSGARVPRATRQRHNRRNFSFEINNYIYQQTPPDGRLRTQLKPSITLSTVGELSPALLSTATVAAHAAAEGSPTNGPNFGESDFGRFSGDWTVAV